jgi:MFS transporter, DHA2 family, multidrug resistance protein
MSTHFRPPNLVLATIGLSLATFMQVLDTTIANVSLPTIAGNLGVSQDQSTWVITSFAVSNAIALPLTGFLTRRFGEVKLFVWATILFSMASFLCGIAQSMGMLIGFRTLQGAVAGPMYPITQALLISIYPPAKRSMALALLAMVTGSPITIRGRGSSSSTCRSVFSPAWWWPIRCVCAKWSPNCRRSTTWV